MAEAQPTTLFDSLEEWRPVIGHTGIYSVSDRGRIRRDAPGQGTWPGRIYRPHTDKKGYLRTQLVAPSGQARLRSVHSIVADAFLGPCPAGCEINHKNGNKSDNRPENLEYMTHGDNVRHAWATGLTKPNNGSANPIAKLTESDVRVIRGLLAEGWSLSQIGRRFGVVKQVISGIKRGKGWRHVA